MVDVQAAALQQQLEATQAEVQKLRAENLQLRAAAQEAADAAAQLTAEQAQLHTASQAAADGELAHLAAVNEQLLAKMAALQRSRSQLQAELASVQAPLSRQERECTSAAAQAESALQAASQLTAAHDEQRQSAMQQTDSEDLDIMAVDVSSLPALAKAIDSAITTAADLTLQSQAASQQLLHSEQAAGGSIADQLQMPTKPAAKGQEVLAEAMPSQHAAAMQPAAGVLESSILAQALLAESAGVEAVQQAQVAAVQLAEARKPVQHVDCAPEPELTANEAAGMHWTYAYMTSQKQL